MINEVRKISNGCPVKCPGVTHNAERTSVKTGDFIIFEYGDGPQHIGRVLGRAITNGDGTAYPKRKPMVAALKLSEGLNHAFVLHVSVEYIVHIFMPGKFLEFFFFGNCPEPQLAMELSSYGGMCENYIHKFLDSSKSISPQWKERR